MTYENEINNAHPLSSDDAIVYKSYEMALKLVGERHEKYDFVDLIHWLIVDKSQTVNNDLK